MLSQRIERLSLARQDLALGIGLGVAAGFGLMLVMMRFIPTAGAALVVPFVLASVFFYLAWVLGFFYTMSTSPRTWHVATLAYLGLGIIVVVARADLFHEGNALLVPVWPSFLLWRDGCLTGLWACPN